MSKSNNPQDIKRHDEAACKFSEAAYQEMASKRYGIEFCCETDKEKWSIKNEIINLNALIDPKFCRDMCPTTITFDSICPGTYTELILVLSGGVIASTIEADIEAQSGDAELYPLLTNDLACFLNPEGCCTDITDCIVAITTAQSFVASGPYSANTQTIFDTIANNMITELGSLIIACDDFTNELTLWEDNEWDPAFTPALFADTMITYVNHLGDEVTVPFVNEMVLGHDLDFDIVVSSAAWEASPNGSLLDYNVWFHTHFTFGT